MKHTSIRDLRALISRSFAVIAMALLVISLIAPDVVDQLISQQSYQNSPLGFVSSVEHLVYGLFH